MANYRKSIAFLLLSSILPNTATAQSDEKLPQPKAQQTVATNDAAQTYTPKETKGKGGKRQQVATGDQTALLTQQGIPVSDNQNSLKIGELWDRILLGSTATRT